MMQTPRSPVCTTNCNDCGVGTLTLNEWYVINDPVWDAAWAGRRKTWHGKIPGQEILCIGCLEQRLGRMLTRADFADLPVNNADEFHMSSRLRDRLKKRRGRDPR